MISWRVLILFWLLSDICWGNISVKTVLYWKLKESVFLNRSFSPTNHNKTFWPLCKPCFRVAAPQALILHLAAIKIPTTSCMFHLNNLCLSGVKQIGSFLKCQWVDVWNWQTNCCAYLLQRSEHPDIIFFHEIALNYGAFVLLSVFCERLELCAKHSIPSRSISTDSVGCSAVLVLQQSK